MADATPPIQLVTGAGRAARAVVALLVALPAFVALALGPASPYLRLACALVLAGAVLHVALRHPIHHNARLVLDAPGEARIAIGDSGFVPIELGRRHWLSPGVSFVRARFRGRWLHLPILPGRQEPGAYRRMLVLLRHAEP